MDDIDTYGTDEPVCPFCGHVLRDAWELTDDEGECECGKCGKTFDYSREVYVLYSTSKPREARAMPLLGVQK